MSSHSGGGNKASSEANQNVVENSGSTAWCLTFVFVTPVVFKEALGEGGRNSAVRRANKREKKNSVSDLSMQVGQGSL